MIFEGFIGSSYISPAVAWDAQRSVNLYLEANESGSAKTPRALIGTPGLLNYDFLPTSPIRGIWTGLADNLPGSSAYDAAFVVAGAKLYEVYQPGTVSTNGTTVTWISGSLFGIAGSALICPGATIVIANVIHTVATVTDSTHLELTITAGVQASAASSAHLLIGDVGDDAAHSPVTFVANGTQLLVTSAGLVWVYNGSTLVQGYFTIGNGTVDTSGTAVTWVSGDQFDATIVGDSIVIGGNSYTIGAFVDAMHITLTGSAGTSSAAVYSIPTGPVMGAMSAFLDNYAIVVPANSKIFYISGFNAAGNSDFTRWDPLDFGKKVAFPDNIASIHTDHEELWIGGTQATEVWRNTGNSDFPLQRDPGAIIAQGVRAPFSFVSIANGVAWIGGDERGNPIAWRADGFTPVRISTHGVETAWAKYSSIADARAFVYVIRGHQFWVISFTVGNATWVYDATAGEWHERAWWNGAGNDRARYSSHGYVFGIHLVGDCQTGNLYNMSEDVFTDSGEAIHRMRTCPHLTNEELWTFYSQFRLSMKGGISPTLSWSDDLGETWHTEVSASQRRIGGAAQNSIWKRLGKSRDRIFRLTITDAAQVALFAAFLDTGASS